MFLLRDKYSYWHLDQKTNGNIIREEDIQIIRDWRSLDNSGPGKVLRTNYGFGLEDIEGWGSPRGLPWWKFRSSSRVKSIECWELPHHTPDQAETFSCILAQNVAADQEEEAAGLVENLQAGVEALKEQRSHMQRKMPKPKKKPKKAVINGWKQKNKFKKPQSIAISQPEQAKGAQTEVPRSQ